MEAILSTTIGHMVFVTASVTFGTFVIVGIGGVLYALIIVGAFELYFRERIQREIVADFLNEFSHGSGVTQGLQVDYLLEKATGIPGDVLFRMHYSQICGQFIATLTKESTVHDAPRVLSVALGAHYPTFEPEDVQAESGKSSRADAQSPTAGVSASLRSSAYEAAVRSVDRLQAQLGTRLLRRVFLIALMIAAAVCMPIALSSLFAVMESAKAVSTHSGFAGAAWDNLISFIQFLQALIFLLASTAALTIGSAIVATIVFSRLDRLVASR